MLSLAGGPGKALYSAALGVAADASLLPPSVWYACMLWLSMFS